MIKVLVENGEIKQIGLPETGFLKDGRSVSGYNLLEESILNEEGWLPLEELKPEYNAETQYLQHEGYTIESDKVISRYIVKNIEQQPYVPTLEERLVAAEAAINDLIFGGGL